MRGAVALLMLGLAVAGCLDGESPDADAGDVVGAVSEKLFDVLPVEEVWVSASDGKALHHAVYRPDTNEPVPVFINFSPYWGNTAELGGDGFAQYMIHEYVPRGYAVVLAAVRGTGHSEGCFEIAGDREVRDLHEVVDFFANEPWSTGAVAAGGKSYDSTTQNGLIAKDPHPALKGIFHVSGITDMYRYNYVNGVPYANGLQFTPRYYATQTFDENVGGNDSPEALARMADDAACPELAGHVASGEGSAAHGMKDAYWQERDWNRYVADSDWNGSVFFVHGLQDWNVKPDHILPWLDNLPPQVRVRGWLHQDTDNNGHVYPMRADWNQTMLAWLDAELKGFDNGFWDDPAFDVEATDGLWRASDAWPAGTPMELEPDEKEWNLNGVTGNEVGGYEAHAHWDLAANGSVRISGAPRIDVRASSAHEDPVLTAILYDLAPDGTETWIGEAVLRGVYRDGLDAPSPLVAGQGYDYQLTAYPLDVVLEQGHSLLARFGEAPAYSVTTPEDTDGVLYDFGPGSGVLTVHVAPADARGDQPVPTPCFAC